MSWIPNQKEIQQVLKLDGAHRYRYFIKKVSDTGKLWGLYNDGWALAEDNEAKKLLPLWPSKEYASLCANGIWNEYEPELLDLHEFLEKYINELSQENIETAIFYTPNDKGISPSYQILKRDLEEELSRIE